MQDEHPIRSENVVHEPRAIAFLGTGNQTQCLEVLSDVLHSAGRNDSVNGPLKRIQRGESAQNGKPKPQENVYFFGEIVDWQDTLQSVTVRLTKG